MLQIDLTATVRKDFGKGASRRLRMKGQTPAILYGPKSGNMALAVETDFFMKSLLNIHGQSAVFNIDIEDSDSKEKRHVMIKELQQDPVHETLVHADFYEISLEDPVTLPVVVNYTGKPIGEDMGGVLQVSARTVQVKGLPLDIPDNIEVDVTALELDGPGVTCKDLEIPGNVTLEEDIEMTCAKVVTPSAVVDKSMMEEEPEVEEVAAEGEEGAEGAEGAEPKAEAKEESAPAEEEK